jgi:hypothetical protein
LNINNGDKLKDNMGKALFILSLFVLGLLIFLIIQKPFLHIDEWFTQGVLNISFKEMVHLTAKDVHPPLYYAIALMPVYLFKWLHIPFDMITLMKMVSVVPYVIIFVISLTKIRKDYGWLVGGLFAFTLLTMADFFTMFSIARMYPWGLLFLVVSFLYACEILRNPSLKSWILLAFFSVCGAYTHYFVAIPSILLYMLLLVHVLLKNKTQIKNWLISTVFGILCFVPWVPYLLKQINSVSGSYWIDEITFETFVQFFASIFTDTAEFYVNLALAIVFLAIFISILIYYRKSKEDADIVLIGSLMFIGTILVGVTVSIVFNPIFIVRYVIPATAVLWLCLSIYISKFDLKRVIIPVVIILVLFSVANIADQVNEISDNHEKLVKNQEFLQSINSNNSVVIIDGMVKYVHFYNQLNDSIVYGGFSVGEREKAKDFTLFYDDKDTRFLMPDDFNKYENKTVYLAYRQGSDIDLPKDVSKEKVGKVENTKFYILKYKG